MLPVGIGAAAFFWPVEDNGTQPSTKGESLKSERRTLRRTETDAVAAFQKMEDDATALRTADRARLDKLDGAAKRAEILRLLELLKAGGDPWTWEIRGRLDHLCSTLVTDEGIAGMHWIAQSAPQQVKSVVEAWCINQPAAAFEYLVQSKRSGECGPSSAMDALAAHVEATGGDAAALMDAVQRMPWYLYKEPADGTRQTFDAPDGIPLKLWVESGAAEYLARQGIEMTGIIDGLLRKNPSLVVGMWSQRTAADPAQGDREVKEMMGSFPLRPPGEKAALRQALMDAGPDVLEEFKASVTRLYELGSEKGGLGEWAEPEPQDVAADDEVNQWWKDFLSGRGAAAKPPEEQAGPPEDNPAGRKGGAE